MKYLRTVSYLCLAALLVCCHETREDVKLPRSEREFYKTIGEEIPFETGMEWIKNYEGRQGEGARTEVLSDYIVAGDTLKSVLNSAADLVGIAFHYGLDNLGEKHIILIPVDASMSLWSAIPGRRFVDANTGESISQTVAESWAMNFREANPSGVWFHFFGKNIFDDMTSLPYFNAVDIEPALSTIGLTPELLLVVWNDSATSTGRTSAQSATVYDASNACPPCAVK